MPTGPPWIKRVYADNLGPLTPGVVTGNPVYHLELDQDRHWTCSAVVIREPGQQTEVSITWLLPGGFGAPPDVIALQMNDAYPQFPLVQNTVWFANEDVYVWVQYKQAFDPNVGWQVSELVSCQTYTDSAVSQNGRAVMNFAAKPSGVLVCNVSVTLACMFTRETHFE